MQLLPAGVDAFWAIGGHLEVGADVQGGLTKEILYLVCKFAYKTSTRLKKFANRTIRFRSQVEKWTQNRDRVKSNNQSRHRSILVPK